MILKIKAKECTQLPDGRWQLTANCEDLTHMLIQHPGFIADMLRRYKGQHYEYQEWSEKRQKWITKSVQL